MFESLFPSQALWAYVVMFLVGSAIVNVFVYLRHLKARLRKNEAEFKAFEDELIRARSLVRMTGMLMPVRILIRGDHEIALICAPLGFKGNIEVQKKQNANG